jgi:hypothetical protein
LKYQLTIYSKVDTYPTINLKSSMGTYSVANTDVTMEMMEGTEKRESEGTLLKHEKPDDMALTQDDVPRDGESTMTTDCTKFNNLEQPIVL